MTSKFASLTEQDIERIVEDKDSQNTKRSTKVAKELFADYVKEKKLRKAEEKKEWAQTLKPFHVEARKKEFVQCIIKGLSGNGYQTKPSASADNPYLDLDYSGYHKNLIQ